MARSRKRPGDIETGWTIATLAVFFGLFIWGADIYVRMFQPPSGALKIYIIAKQWMWKAEHPGGQREIDAVHLPIGRPIELVMTSEDVIHDFSVPAFRIKHDVLPDRYETLWFTVDRPGTYHLYCTQLCGTSHAKMVGEIVAMTGTRLSEIGWSKTAQLTRWLRRARRCSCAMAAVAVTAATVPAEVSPAGTVRAPRLAGLYGSSRTSIGWHGCSCR